MPVADVAQRATSNRLDDVGHDGAEHADVLEQQVADQVLLTAVEALRIRHGDDALSKAKSGVHCGALLSSDVSHQAVGRHPTTSRCTCSGFRLVAAVTAASAFGNPRLLAPSAAPTAH